MGSLSRSSCRPVPTFVNPRLSRLIFTSVAHTSVARWNNADGIMHLGKLSTHDGRARPCARNRTTPRRSLPECRRHAAIPTASATPHPPDRNTSVDPRVVYDVTALVRKPFSVTLRVSIGLYSSTTTTPDGPNPTVSVDNYWTILAATQGRSCGSVPGAGGRGICRGDISIGAVPLSGRANC